MIHLVTAENEHFYKDEMQQARRLDSRRDYGNSCAGPEHDEPPAEKCHNAVHMLYIVSSRVLGYQRLLPTMRPQFRSNVIPQLWLSEPEAGGHIWEMSCHCIAPTHPSDTRSTGKIAHALALALIQWGIEHRVTQIVTAIDPADILWLTQLLFQPIPLGLPLRLPDREIIAVIVSFDERTLARIRGMRPAEEAIPANRRSFLSQQTSGWRAPA